MKEIKPIGQEKLQIKDVARLKVLAHLETSVYQNSKAGNKSKKTYY